MSRARLAGGYVEITLANGDVAAARSAADERARLPARSGDHFRMRSPAGPGRRAPGGGSARIRLSRSSASAGGLARARRGLRGPPAPRMLIAAACRAIGDDDGAELEVAGAIAVFERLDAVHDAAAARAAQHVAAPPSSGPTAREEEVLAHIAKGLTNRQIAERLVVSEKTVATHVGYILTKLGLPSRAAATAYMYEHGLHGDRAPGAAGDCGQCRTGLARRRADLPRVRPTAGRLLMPCLDAAHVRSIAINAGALVLEPPASQMATHTSL